MSLLQEIQAWTGEYQAYYMDALCHEGRQQGIGLADDGTFTGYLMCRIASWKIGEGIYAWLHPVYPDLNMQLVTRIMPGYEMRHQNLQVAAWNETVDVDGALGQYFKEVLGRICVFPAADEHEVYGDGPILLKRCFIGSGDRKGWLAFISMIDDVRELFTSGELGSPVIQSGR